ncbi:mammalian cell entry protein [Rhodococcus sp. 05-340-1]|uniref:MCE family protein n=1 Tax=unclassified Rhodococcus (in: high G+C Gram-positive bacteria) TaxID=192944 RepID=UPI000B9AF66B|nr:MULTISPECIES: MCE family protein [unclassified Rhodococcus (in: high G+C Gram-positive bacteria)]OZD69156.1 mammalian cell entry protein [Rhodococcus sp. 05-340-2]OZD73477.1 mammalian cell entry protein [Rhodococcus sp. 05-340-1]OZF34653.1 mammalian cell entry protein [Rhodococcus sp. 14-2483-1-2]
MKRVGLSLPRPRPYLLVVAAALAAVVVLTTGAVAQRVGTNHVSAYFTNTAGLYVGDRVMILGVEVGSIDEITPEGDRVRVDMSYDNDNPVPVDAGAVIVAPTLVTGRYVQLAPVYSGGPTLEDGDIIELERTASPVEFDEIKKQVVTLARDVGRTPENPDGALTDFVSTTADTLAGNGQTLHDSLVTLSEAVHTLDSGSPDLFATVQNLQSVTSALAANDDRIVGFSSELAGLSGFLNDNRTELDATLSSMSTTFAEVTSFVNDNRELLNNDVSKLNTLTTLLVDKEDTLAQILHTAPTAMSNFYNIYDEKSDSLTGALAVADAPDPRSLICALLTTANAPADECTKATDSIGRGLAGAGTEAGTR